MLCPRFYDNRRGQPSQAVTERRALLSGVENGRTSKAMLQAPLHEMPFLIGARISAAAGGALLLLFQNCHALFVGDDFGEELAQIIDFIRGN